MIHFTDDHEVCEQEKQAALRESRTLSAEQWEADREQVARAVALTDDEDGCFERIDAWNAMEDWEREASDEDILGDTEDCDYHLKRADIALTALGFRRAEEAVQG